MSAVDSMTDIPRADPAGAFAELYRRQFGFVWSLAGHYGVPWAEREDVAQEVWITVHRRWAALRADASTRAWLAAITRRIASRHRRGRERATRRHERLAEQPLPVVTGVEPDAIARIEAALARMDPAQREVFLLTQVEELSGPEVATVLAVPLNTVYSRLRLARARLAESLARMDDDVPRILGAVRSHEQPSTHARSRVWAVLGLGAALPTASAGGIGTWAMIGAAVIVVGTTVVAVVTGSDDERTNEVAIEEPEVPASTAAPATMPVVAPVVTPPPSVATVASDGSARSVASPRPEVPASTELGPVDAPGGNDLAAEAALLGEARTALARGDHTAADGALSTHRTRFAAGELAVEREALQVRTWCAAGSTDRARTLADRLLAEHPEVPAVAAIRDRCR